MPTVVAIVDDLTIMGNLEALVTVDEARDDLQKPSNHLVNLTKQYVYTMNESLVATTRNSESTSGSQSDLHWRH